MLTGNPGTGKTALMLKLVELSCFGRGEPIYQGIYLIIILTQCTMNIFGSKSGHLFFKVESEKYAASNSEK